jgi:hypothetical protein
MLQYYFTLNTGLQPAVAYCMNVVGLELFKYLHINVILVAQEGMQSGFSALL